MSAAASKQIALVEDTIEPLGNRKTDTPAEPPSKLKSAGPSPADFQVRRPDTALFATLQGLQMQSGVPSRLLRRLVLKELTENGLDAADAAGRYGLVDIGRIGDNRYRITDQGTGINLSANQFAELFSIGREMLSRKFWRLPSRGCLGNGIRIIVGTIAATGGIVEVSTRNQHVLLRPLKTGRTEIVETGPIDHPIGTSIVVTFGPDLPADAADLSWAQTAIALARIADPPYARNASPHWFDTEQLHETLRIIEPPGTTVRQFVERLDGCTGAKAGQIAAPFGKNRTCNTMS
jgi:hypothetical protein